MDPNLTIKSTIDVGLWPVTLEKLGLVSSWVMKSEGSLKAEVEQGRGLWELFQWNSNMNFPGLKTQNDSGATA